jgi:hypothetical protein
VDDKDKTTNPEPKVQPPSDPWRARFIRYAKSKMDERKAKKQKETPTDRAARVATKATVWIAIFTCVSVAVSIGTFLILKSQLKEMHDSGTDTHALAQEAKTQAEKTSDMADAAQKIRQAANGIVSQEQRIADETQKALENSNNALRMSTEQYKREHRAWISLDGIGLFREESDGMLRRITVGQIKPTDTLFVNLDYKNVGATLALDVACRADLQSFPVSVEKPIFSPLPPPEQGIILGIVHPNSGGFQSIYVDWGSNPPDAALAAIKADQLIVYMHARADYRDAYGVKHWATFCRFLTSGGGWSGCKNERDSIDDYPREKLPEPN